MPAPSTEWTLEMVHALPDDGNRYELIDGELLVTPAPSYGHQGIVSSLVQILGPYAKSCGLVVLCAPAAVTFSRRREVQPDVLVLPLVNGRMPRVFEEAGRLELAVEILSPTTARHDRVTKRRVYQEERVSEYWIVDPDARCVEHWRPGETRPEIVIDMLEWRPAADHDALRIDLPALFRAALD